MKLIESYCRGQVGLYEETLTDGSLVYYVKAYGSELMPVPTLKDGVALCDALVKHTV